MRFTAIHSSDPAVTLQEADDVGGVEFWRCTQRRISGHPVRPRHIALHAFDDGRPFAGSVTPRIRQHVALRARDTAAAPRLSAAAACVVNAMHAAAVITCGQGLFAMRLCGRCAGRIADD